METSVPRPDPLKNRCRLFSRAIISSRFLSARNAERAGKSAAVEETSDDENNVERGRLSVHTFLSLSFHASLMDGLFGRV